MFKIDPFRRTIGFTFGGGKAAFRCCAPLAKEVELVLQDASRIALTQDGHYWTLGSSNILPGVRYKISVDGGEPVPDPNSVYQPEGVHGPSMAGDLTAFNWQNRWNNHPLGSYVIYELHIGLFTPGGTFDSAVERLDYLVELGITAIELMPIAQFSGARNWGYDGVFPFAVQNTYGGPEALMRFVETCHSKGLAVILDTVYNHLGPEGNYLPLFGPCFTDKYKTPWGNALNYDDAYSDGIRTYFIENALMWFRDFKVDALRLDAVHAIKDFGAIHFLQELRLQVDSLRHATGHEHYLMIECDLNDPKFIDPLSQGGYQMDAQWSDEFHHALRVAAGLSRDSYYEDFQGTEDLAKAYLNGYVFTGQYSEHRKKNFGKLPSGQSNANFVVFSQNHDQVGNRMLGERSIALHGFALCKVLATAVILGPYIPLLFMGEEYAEESPFLYFVDHEDAHLNSLVAEGRKKEFESFQNGTAPDPSALETFEKSRPLFEQNERGKEMLAFYKKLIKLRKEEPALKRLQRNTSIKNTCASDVLWITRSDGEAAIHLLLNFGKDHFSYSLPIDVHFSRLIDSRSDDLYEPLINIELKAESALVLKEIR